MVLVLASWKLRCSINPEEFESHQSFVETLEHINEKMKFNSSAEELELRLTPENVVYDVSQGKFLKNMLVSLLGKFGQSHCDESHTFLR